MSVPWQEDALHHRKVLHENISVWFRAEVSHSITDAQLDGAFECSWCRLTNKLDILELGIFFVALSCTFSCFQGSSALMVLFISFLDIVLIYKEDSKLKLFDVGSM